MTKIWIDDCVKKALDTARETYGNKNQILVCMEELNELACVLAKYPRYSDENEATKELQDKVLDEFADVLIILSHVQSIFELSDEMVNARVEAKIERLRRWLLHSKSMQETIDDREVATASVKGLCMGCKHSKVTSEKEFMNICRICHLAQATEGIAPFYEGE